MTELDLLVFGAHPDDAELGAAGTIASTVAEGKSVGIIDLTRGELGTRGCADDRDQEASKAAKILGVSFRENLGFADGFFENNKEHQLAIIKKIRKYRPKIVIANAVHDRHIDHGRGAKLVSDACFLSGLQKISTTDENGNIQEAFRPKHVYHMIQWYDFEPDFVVDISHTIDKKVASILAYSTQFYDPNSKEPETPISSKNFLESIKYRAQNMGRITGVDYAEGFTVQRYPLINSLFDIH
jgi:bacillithiol biosynthesis deacetylase BshB1